MYPPQRKRKEETTIPAETGTAATPPSALIRVVTNPHLLMILATFIFGANYVVGRAATGEVPPYMLGFTRWAGASLIVLPFTLRYVRADWQRVRANWKLLVLAGTLMPFLGAGVTYVAMTKTIAINAGIVQTSLSIFTVLLARIFLAERLGRLQVLGAVAAIIGVLVIVLRGDLAVLLSLSINTGDVILVFCNMALAGYAITVKRLPAGFHPMTVLSVVFVVGAAVHAPFMIGEFVGGEAINHSLVALSGMLFVALFPSVVAIMCWNHAIATLGPNRASFYMYLVPVFTALLGFALLGETLAVYHIAGCVLIVAGVTLSTRGRG